MTDCYCTLRDDIPTPLDNIRGLFEHNRIPVLAPIPTALVDSQPCYEIDINRLSDAQIYALAEHVYQKYKDNPDMPNLDTAIAAVREGLPIGKLWTSGVGGGAQSALAFMGLDDDCFSENSEALEWFESEGLPDFGTCCACRQQGETVRNFVTLPKQAPVAGTGWSCVVCNLPDDGALAVLCDQCLETNAEIQDVIHGMVDGKKRSPFAALTQDFDHDPALHEADIATFAGLGCDS
jgi:hypothetical protein